VEASVGLTTEAEMSALLLERLADVGLGPRLPDLVSEPIMRYRLVVVASPRHRLAAGDGTGAISASVIVDHDWLVGPSAVDHGSDVSRLLEQFRIPESRLRVFGSESAAWAAAAAGEGVAPAVDHLVAPDVRRGALAVLPVEATPVDLLWYVSTISPDRRSPAATRLRRFLATADAMHVMHRADRSVPASRFRPPVYVTLWS
jgi:LysR family transcriptional regulator, low CO2-responsive transcriptional regulator